jgi:hypothetical protein
MSESLEKARLYQRSFARMKAHYERCPSADLAVRELLFDHYIQQDAMIRVNDADLPTDPSRPPFLSLGHLLLRHGVSGTLGHQAFRLPVKKCFDNAFEIWSEHSDRYIYCEGMAQSVFLPTHHAWLIDSETRQIVDPTWRAEWIGKTCAGFNYAGIPMSPDYLLKMRAKSGSVLQTSRYEYPLVSGEHSIEDAVHPDFHAEVMARNYPEIADTSEVIASNFKA